ncbi:MAG: YdcF family protein [Deltaproteobacteria bacterium]|nr:YdcF family protein [Deltaproteobacteria bacterium]MBI5810589.1 YdcF family protein [Deltaproteobacteria bacterium]
MSGRENIAFKAVKRFCIAFTLIALVIMYTPVANILARPLIVEEGALKRSDIIAVLGGGAYKNGVLGGASTERLIKGLLLYRKGWSRRLIFSGGSIGSQSRKILRDVFKPESPAHISAVEAEIMKDISVVLGIPGQDAALDAVSTNTRENLRNIRAYMEKEGLKTCILVTSATHMRRSQMAAQKLGLDCVPAPIVDTTMYRTGAIDRAGLLREIMWEYAGLALYRIYGYI